MNYNIPSSREPIVAAGDIASRSWWRFFQAMFQNLKSGNDTISVSGISFAGQTSHVGTQTATLGNAPASGNPAFWLRVTVNGAN